MKTEIFLLIIAGCLTLIAFIGLIIYGLASEKGNERAINFGKKLGKSALILIAFIFFVALDRTGKSNTYYIMDEQEFSEKHNLPQLDSTMTFVLSSKKSSLYRSWSKDSILHFSKSIEYDLFDVYSVTDSFLNLKDSLRLESIFIKHNILRDSANIYILRKWVEYPDNNADTISRKEFDKLIGEWGLADKIYKRFEFY